MLNIDLHQFTERGYKEILELTKQYYQFYYFTDYKSIKKGVLWRHDIDHSVHRAAALAEIEYRAGVQATYFIYLHSSFYNVLEKEIQILLKKIKDYGHAIGLHYEPSFYNLKDNDTKRMQEYAQEEKMFLERIMGCEIYVCSFHNPDVGGNWHLIDEEIIAGMISTYSLYLRNEFEYCSDSNGYWRYKKLDDVIKQHPDRLHVLTHPEWWQQKQMAPRDRILRCANIRAQRNMEIYDSILKDYGRLNVTNEILSCEQEIR